MKNKGYFGGARRSDKKAPKRIIIIAAIVVAIFVPAIAAWINYSLKSNDTKSTPDNLMNVSLYEDNTLLFEEEEDPEKATADTLVSIFDSILKNRTEAQRAPNLAERTPLRAVVTVADTSDEYLCYFSEDDDDNYCVDSSEKVYLISTVDAQHFMTSQYAETLYAESIPPLLYTSAGDAVTPVSVDWKYQDISGAMRSAQKAKTAEAELMYNMAGALGISFDTEPDECSVKIYKSGIVIYTGTYTNMSEIIVEPGTTLQLKVDAIWKASPEKKYAGTVSYDFKVLLRDRSEFILNKTELTTGDFIAVACTNILDPSKISFKSEPDIGFTPKFFEDGDIVRALIPFGDNLEAGDYSLTFVYGAAEETISVALSAHPNPDTSYTVDDTKEPELFKNTVSADLIFKDIMKKLDSSHTDYIFFRSSFDDYSNQSATKTYAYGYTFKTSDDTVTHTIKGEFWSSDEGKDAPVTALNSGYVAYSGSCDYLGNFVVLEHGMGLRTVYGHLESNNVKAGDYVKKGEIVGYTGKLNKFSDEGVFIQCYIFDTPVDYSKIAGQQIKLYTIPEQTTKTE
ncbi:MAG: M23 family metallopeptidase [Clostridia bacterium]|nr:M23 family metallopeptidase [Clostridia bacterium]